MRVVLTQDARTTSRGLNRIVRAGHVCSFYAAIILLSFCGIASVEPGSGGSTDVYAASVSDAVKCDMQKVPCATRIDNLEVILDITPKPVKAMEELHFCVEINGSRVDDGVVIDLAMPGMYMGGNKIVLKRADSGRYCGKGIIPRCPSGTKLWSVTIDIPRKGKVEFLFDVVY